MAASSVYQLFVYGSLRSGFRSTAYEYISRYFSFIGDAKVKGRLYDMGSYPAGLPADDGAFIIGELYGIKDEAEFSWAMAQLDDYEGVNVESDEVQLFRRELTDVYIGDKTNTSWIYWYNGDVSDKPAIESGDLIEYLKRK